MSEPKVKHLIPDERSPHGGLWRHAENGEHQRAELEVDKVLHTVKVELEAKDPLTLALLFRELRQASGHSDVDDAFASLSFVFSGLTAEEAQAVKAVAELSWTHIFTSDPEIETIYYRKARRAK